MKAKLAAVCFIAGALLVPVAGYTADTKEPSKMDSAKEFVDDSVITTKIKAEFAKDKAVSAMNIKVDTDKGVVKLSGNAKSKDEADKAVITESSTTSLAASILDGSFVTAVYPATGTSNAPAMKHAAANLAFMFDLSL